jgi:hypothetical protein
MAEGIYTYSHICLKSPIGSTPRHLFRRSTKRYIYLIVERNFPMPRPNRLTKAKPKILATLSGATEKVYSQASLANLFRMHRNSWNLPPSLNVQRFISFLMKEEMLQTHNFKSKTYGRRLIRYSWGEVPLLQLALSLGKRGYFCHRTAASFHGLAKPDKKTIYLNIEQSIKPSGEGSLTQEAIDRAFSGKQRQSKLIYKYNDNSVVMISGKNTARLGVVEMTIDRNDTVPVTNIERTLIDLTVRPAYGGGPSEVLKSYRNARGRISVDRLLNILKRLDYTYPYHQSIGFLMQRAGYAEEDYAKLRSLGLNHDFYLAHGIQAPQYSEEWRLFHPKDFT